MAATAKDGAAGADSSRRLRFCFGKSARIASHDRFGEVMDAAPKRAGRYVVAWAARTDGAPESRLGVVASKRTFRHAVDRNRARRLVREAFRRLRPGFAGTGDVVVVARGRIAGAREPEVREDLRRLFEGFGLLPAAEGTGA